MATTSQDPKKFNDYDGFVEKFKPKKTTDDCYTPPEIYEIVKGWACREYGIDPAKVVRPFWPGGEYEHFNYSGGAVVIDNPPFSIRAKIQRFYLDRGIPFFLFAPALTCITASQWREVCAVVCGCEIVYENGASVRTSFVTSYNRPVVLRSAPELTRMVNAKMVELKKKKVKSLPKYIYPDEVLTAAMMMRYSSHSIDFAVRSDECRYINDLDAQRSAGKRLFGGGLLLSKHAAAEHAAAERAAAERAAAEREKAKRWALSDREREIVDGLSRER